MKIDPFISFPRYIYLSNNFVRNEKSPHMPITAWTTSHNTMTAIEYEMHIMA